MYEFQSYNPDRPRMVTSFKGNQKLIFQGYRYNIHHIVVQKGVKTWRCVCAKKLTSARSWCKGRAETWDNDEQGTAKGEHNHPAEHDVAELEYFKVSPFNPSIFIIHSNSEPTHSRRNCQSKHSIEWLDRRSIFMYEHWSHIRKPRQS